MDDALPPPEETHHLKALLAQREQIIVRQQSTIATLTQQRDEYQLDKLRLEMRLAKLLKQVYGPRADRLSDPAQLLLDFARRLESLPTAADMMPPEEAAVPGRRTP